MLLSRGHPFRPRNLRFGFAGPRFLGNFLFQIFRHHLQGRQPFPVGAGRGPDLAIQIVIVPANPLPVLLALPVFA
jgi:hypothetical protein